MTKPKPKKLQISHNGWSVTIIKGSLSIKKNAIRRSYTLTYPNGGIEHKRGSDHFYVRCEDYYYQFKIEDNGCLSGDKFYNDDVHLENVAYYPFN